MRDYRFRVYNPADETMTYNVGLDRISEYADETLVKMLQTGLKDRNGTNIYEGDIVKGKDDNDKRIIGEVQYRVTRNSVNGIGKYVFIQCELNRSFEIIGNRFDTPELLKQENGEEVKV